MTSAPVWNVCLSHGPVLGGLYRAVNDFARAMGAPILSFDAGCRPHEQPDPRDDTVRIGCGNGLFSRGCHALTPAATTAADAAIADAGLLIVHSMFRAHAPWAAEWTRRHGGRYWAVPHGCLDPWGLRQRGLAKRAWLTIHGRRFLADADWVLFSTRRTRDKALHWASGSHTAVVHWPVAIPSLRNRDKARSRLRTMLGIPAAAPLLLFVGRLHAVKRPLETIQRFCRATTGPAHLVMVCGVGDIARSQLTAVIPPSHGGRVHLVGPCDTDALATVYLASDGFLSLSCQENFGYAAAEAAAYGLPLILSPGHDLAHDMPRTPAGNLACGWLLPDDSEPAAIEAISAWATAAASATTSQRGMGATARLWATETLGFDVFQSALCRLAEGAGRRTSPVRRCD